MRLLTTSLLLLSALAGATPLQKLSVPDVSLEGTDGKPHPLRALLKDSRLTVFTFFSADCPCMAAHDGTLRQLEKDLGAQGVRFYLVDSEVGASLARDQAEAKRRGYQGPILLDKGGVLSRALEARYATHTTIIDAGGRVHYRGGIDSSKQVISASTKPYLRQALESLLGGREPNPAEPKSLGCYLRQS